MTITEFNKLNKLQKEEQVFLLTGDGDVAVRSSFANSWASESILVTDSDIGATDDTWKEQGVVSMSGFSKIAIEVTLDVNDSTGCQLQVLTGSDSTPTGILETATDYQKALGDADKTITYIFNTDGVIPYISIQTKATVVGATEGIVSINIIKL